MNFKYTFIVLLLLACLFTLTGAQTEYIYHYKALGEDDIGKEIGGHVVEPGERATAQLTLRQTNAELRTWEASYTVCTALHKNLEAGYLQLYWDGRKDQTNQPLCLDKDPSPQCHEQTDGCITIASRTFTWRTSPAFYQGKTPIARFITRSESFTVDTVSTDT